MSAPEGHPDHCSLCADRAEKERLDAVVRQAKREIVARLTDPHPHIELEPPSSYLNDLSRPGPTGFDEYTEPPELRRHQHVHIEHDATHYNISQDELELQTDGVMRARRVP